MPTSTHWNRQTARRLIVAMWLHIRPAQDSVNDCTCAAPPFTAKAGVATA